MKEAPLEQHEVQLTSDYRLGVDKMNFILTKRHQKREGRGKNAPLSDEYVYDKSNANYFGKLKALSNQLVDKEFLEGMNEQDLSKVEDVVEAINKALAHVDKVKEEIYEHINNHITIDLGETNKKAPTTKKIKGIEVSLEGNG